MEQAQEEFQEEPMEAVEAPEVENIEETQDVADPDNLEEEQEDLDAVDKFVEVDYNDTKYNVPEELKDAFMRNKDYTQKTQTLADERRALETHQAEFQQAMQLQQSNLEGYAQLASMSQQLQQYEGVDWQAFTAEAPEEANQAYIAFNELQRKAGALQNTLQQQQSEALQQQNAIRARQIEQGKAELARDIPDWSADLAEQLVDYGIKNGGDERSIRAVTEPWMIKTLRKAMLYDKSLENATKPEPVKVKPVSKVRGKATATKNPDKMSTEEWLKWRNKQVHR